MYFIGMSKLLCAIITVGMLSALEDEPFYCFEANHEGYISPTTESIFPGQPAPPPNSTSDEFIGFYNIDFRCLPSAQDDSCHFVYHDGIWYLCSGKTVTRY